MSRRSPQRWLVNTVMEVFEKSHYSNFLRHQKSHNENFFELLKGHTLFSTNMYDKVTGIFGRPLMQKYEHF